MKSKRKAPAKPYKSKYSAQNKSYGVGGAVMTLGKNLLQGKKFGSGAFKGVLRAGITPGSGIGAGIGLAGALAGKSKNPTMQKISKGLGVAGNVAGLFTGGGGAGALGGLAGKFAGSGAGQAASKFAGNFAGLDKTLGGIGAASGGNPLMALAQNFMPGMSGAEGMRVRKYEDGGEIPEQETEPLSNKEFRQSDNYAKAAERQARPYQKADDTEELLGMLENSENVEERRLILGQLKRALSLAATGAGVSAYFASPGMSRSRIHRFIKGGE